MTCMIPFLGKEKIYMLRKKMEERIYIKMSTR